MNSLWICGRVLRSSQRPSGRMDKLLITLARYQQLDHTRWLRAHIPTGSITNFMILIVEVLCVFALVNYITQGMIERCAIYLKLGALLSCQWGPL